MCVNPEAVTGRLYCLTDAGKRAVRRVFGIRIESLPDDMDWHAYSFVVRGAVRRLVIQELGAHVETAAPYRTAAQIRRSLKERTAVSLGQVCRALRQLRNCGLVEFVADTCRHESRLNVLTECGQRILRQLQK